MRNKQFNIHVYFKQIIRIWNDAIHWFLTFRYRNDGIKQPHGKTNGMEWKKKRLVLNELPLEKQTITTANDYWYNSYEGMLAKKLSWLCWKWDSCNYYHFNMPALSWSQWEVHTSSELIKKLKTKIGFPFLPGGKTWYFFGCTNTSQSIFLIVFFYSHLLANIVGFNAHKNF